MLLQAADSTLEVATARGGREALDLLRDDRPDLVLLDILMPDMDGWQVLQEKSQDETIKDIPVIIISAQDPREGPMVSGLLLSTISNGLSVSKLLRCSQQVAKLLLESD